MKEKTAKEWFETLPEPYRSQCIDAMIFESKVYSTLHEAIHGSTNIIEWNRLFQVYFRAKNGEFDTPQTKPKSQPPQSLENAINNLIEVARQHGFDAKVIFEQVKK